VIVSTNQQGESVNTIEHVMSRHSVAVPEHLEAQAEIPVKTGLQRQGDIIVIPSRKGKISGLVPVPAEGIPVVRGEAGGNTHLLVADGTVSWAPKTDGGPALGTLDVEEGTAYLLHPEHGAQGIGEGQYTIRRQVEQADAIRLVQD
jgi:hypothetical protein